MVFTALVACALHEFARIMVNAACGRQSFNLAEIPTDLHLLIRTE
jgi:hypothetical protein